MNVGIVGCGLIGQKRAAALGEHKLVACADSVAERAQALASRHGGAVCADWRALLARADVDVVIVATTHDSLAEIALAAIEAGKHVLVEKPAARSPDELHALAEAAVAGKRLVRVGFNHRYHRAFRQARQLVRDGEVGPLMFVRARYGHGGRLGYEREWRAQPAVSGGGELMDQGVHLIDLARWFLGDFTDVQGHAATLFWDMPVDDNGFMLLRTADNKVAWLHASCTEWKNTFSFEIYGRTGKLHIEGLGGSYGVEKLSFYRMLLQMGPPETTIWEYPMADDSWAVEFEEFARDIALAREPAAGIAEAQAALAVVHRIYELSGYDHRS